MTDYRAFVCAWYQYPTLAEVSQALGVDRRAASNMAAHLRRHKIPLPPKPSGHGLTPGGKRRVDWSELMLLAFELKAGQRLAEEKERSRVEAERYRTSG